MDCLWDDPGDPDGNVHHVLNRHPEMKSTQFIEKIFSTFSGDEDAYTSRKNRFEIEKTYAGHLGSFSSWKAVQSESSQPCQLPSDGARSHE